MSGSGRKLACRGKAPLKIRNDIVDVLDADGQPDIAAGNACRQLIFGRKLRMRCGRGMDSQAACIPNISDMVEKLQGIDQPASGFSSAGQFEADQAAKLSFQIFLGARALNSALLGWMDDTDNFRPLGEEISHRLRILDVALDPQRQRLKTLNDLKSVEWR
jgi:hypothetical protein